MDAHTLSVAMGCSLSRAESFVTGFNQALVQAQCTTVNRVAMFCAQTGTESGGLKWLSELASGKEYEGRRDLGNVRPGWGMRYKGRGIIQCTGASNYRAFSAWAHALHLVPTESYFFDHPEEVALPPWAFISASWYWVVARPKLNGYADAGNVLAATKAINGGTHGLADRQRRWDACRRLGPALLPGPVGPPLPPPPPPGPSRRRKDALLLN